MRKPNRDAASRVISNPAKVDVGRDGSREGARGVRRQSHEDPGARPSRAAPDDDLPPVRPKQQNTSAAKQPPQVPRATLDLRRPEPRHNFSHGWFRLRLPRPDGPQLPKRVAAELKNTRPASSAGRVIDAKDELQAKFGVTPEAPILPQKDPLGAGATIANLVKARATETPVTAVGPSTLLTEKEVAAMLSLSCATLRNWRVKGLGPRFVQLSRRAVRYRPADIDEWLASRSRRSTSATDGADA